MERAREKIHNICWNICRCDVVYGILWIACEFQFSSVWFKSTLDKGSLAKWQVWVGGRTEWGLSQHKTRVHVFIAILNYVSKTNSFSWDSLVSWAFLSSSFPFSPRKHIHIRRRQQKKITMLEVTISMRMIWTTRMTTDNVMKTQ